MSMTDSTKTPYEQFPLGSRIRVIDQDHALYGQTGAVISKGRHNMYTEVTVRMDDGREYYWTPETIEFEDAPSGTSDPIEPNHYQHGGVNFIEFIEHLPGNRFNAMKYLYRAGVKSPDTLLEDLKKAQWSLNREIERLERDAP